MTPRRIILVGPSGSGKSTVAEAVARNLGLPCISMDDFRIKMRSLYVLHRSQRVRTFESPELWDSNAISYKLRACIRANSGFVVEGNHLLHYPAVASIADSERFYLDVPFKVSLARRKTRHRYLAADESFALIGEGETARYVWPQQALPGVMVLDGTKPVANIVSAILFPPVMTKCTMDV